MVKQHTTTDELAQMVLKGFKDVDRRFDDVDRRFDSVEDRLERIEKLILVDHKRRIERPETEMKELRELFAVK